MTTMCDGCWYASERARETGSTVECVCGQAYPTPDRLALAPDEPSAQVTYAPRQPLPLAPDARVSVAHAPRPSSAPPVARLTHVEDAETADVRRLLCELRPDKGGPLGWGPSAEAPVGVGSNWTPALRVQTSVEVPAILPGAFASRATESQAPRLDPDTTLGWLQRHGTLAAGLRPLYATCAEARASAEVRAKWAGMAARERLAAAVVHGRKLVREAMAAWWATGEGAPTAADAAALRSAQMAEVAGMVARQTERASTATGEALARVRGRMGMMAAEEGAGG